MRLPHASARSQQRKRQRGRADPHFAKTAMGSLPDLPGFESLNGHALPSIARIFSRSHRTRSNRLPQCGALDADEGAVAIEVVEAEPEDAKSSEGYQRVSKDSEVFGEARKEDTADLREWQNFRGHVSDDRVHADDDKEKSPAAVSLHVYQPVERRQEQQTPSAGPQHHRTRPDVLDDREGETPEPSGEQACAAGGRKPLSFARAWDRRAQQVARENAHEHRRAKAEAAQNPGVRGAVLKASEKSLVNPHGKIAVGRENAGAVTRDGDKGEKKPVHDEQRDDQRGLSAHPQFHERYRGDQVSRGNGLKRVAVELQVVWVEGEKVALCGHAEDPQHHHAISHLAVNLPARFAEFDALPDGERHGDSDDEQEQWHDEIPAYEAFPVDMVELPVEPVRKGIREEFANRHHKRSAPHDPEHVEAAQSINGAEALRGADDVGFGSYRFARFHDGFSCDVVGWPSSCREAQQCNKARAHSGRSCSPSSATALDGWRSSRPSSTGGGGCRTRRGGSTPTLGGAGLRRPRRGATRNAQRKSSRCRHPWGAGDGRPPATWRPSTETPARRSNPCRHRSCR